MRALTAVKLLQPRVSCETRRTAVVEAAGLGVRYGLGSRREDVQSLIYSRLFPRRKEKEFWALRDVDLAGYGGDIIGIIGANGAGKTTLCRILSGLLRPDEGRVSVEGQVSALLSLDAGFNDQLSGRDNIFLKGMMIGLTRRQVRDVFTEIVEFSGIARFIDEPLKHYSMGMKARLGFSIAAAIEPDLLLLDEVLGAGDFEFSEKAAQRMQQLIAKTKVAIVVTHQLDFAERYCNRLIWLSRGRIVAQGTPSEVAQRYKDSVSVPARRPVDFRHTKTPKRDSRVAEVSGLGIQFALYHRRSIRFRRSSGFWALQDISFAVNEGEIVGIIGRNGAGKTTLCKVLSGILEPDRGKVRVDGETTALVTYGMGFNNQLTGRDNIYLNGMMLGISRKRLAHLSPAIVEFSDLGNFVDEPVKKYSRGMRARLGFSIAAAIRPDVLVIDEALTVGDLEFYERATAKIQQLIAEAKAVVIVTHNLAFVENICTRALWLDRGTLRFDGSPREAVSAYTGSPGN
jgi:teichoic acid transport system ATP-binding protein